MPAEPDRTGRRADGAPRPEAPRLALSRREALLGGCGALALTAFLVGCNGTEEVAGTAPRPTGEPWDDGTYWDDGTGWV